MSDPVTPWTVACQAPLFVEFPRNDYWSGLPFPYPRNLPDPGIKPVFSALQVDSFTDEPTGKPKDIMTSSFLIRRTSLVAQTVKRLPTMQVTWVWSLGREEPLEKEMATHSGTLALRIPWVEEPGGLQSMGSQRVGHDWVTSLSYGQMSNIGIPELRQCWDNLMLKQTAFNITNTLLVMYTSTLCTVSN